MHTAEHPSFASVPPSSHSSPHSVSMFPSPQTGAGPLAQKPASQVSTPSLGVSVVTVFAGCTAVRNGGVDTESTIA